MKEYRNWFANENGDGTSTIADEGGQGRDLADTRSAADERAVARLLAAAPDLLASLHCLLGTLNADELAKREATMKVVRAALKKAESP